MTPTATSRLPERIGSAFGQLGFGTAQFGNLGCEVDEQTCHDAVAAAWEHGLRYFDTAPHYGLGLSEQRLGRALTGWPRERYVVSTKVGRLLRPNTRPTGTDLDQGYAVSDSLTRERDFSAGGVRKSLAESLERLGLDRVDIVWLHDPEEPDDRFDEAIRGAVPALDQLRDEGVISAWGVGSKDPSMIKRFVDASDPDLVMVAGRYTLLEQETVGLMSACRERGVGVVAVGVFNSGLLAQDEPPADAWYEYAPAPPHVVARARALASVAREHGVSLPRAALTFPRRHPAVVNVTAGMRSREHVARNRALSTNDVPDEFWADLRARGLLEEDV
ncbi:D-threo-aldose 1-dehydrogenase [Lipingzhangella halophila]|uniref:D-threo-aldose 1-dehydrogenase n=1 Tax=Lipingzhangella halophila TaxID=1783352 RepID=A0A7W7RHW6_9ACTN|nr:aldo/keto reductase [Lipingzhangella halophila]MBB4932316.1 D-threo-aldose 1-dehydrogenase [Lipingzhangella halophila]